MFTVLLRNIYSAERTLPAGSAWPPTQISSSLSRRPQVHGLPRENCRCIQGLANYCILLIQVPNFPAPGQASIIPQPSFGCFSAVLCRTLHSALHTWVSLRKNLVWHSPARVPGCVAVSLRLCWRPKIWGYGTCSPHRWLPPFSCGTLGHQKIISQQQCTALFFILSLGSTSSPQGKTKLQAL